METRIVEALRETPAGREAEAILRACVHCGFCTAACPTYRLLGNELDSPRGRIYLIKQLLEGAPAGPATRLHLDRCLTCRSCETACPSGVHYSRLLETGRRLALQHAPRAWPARLARAAARRLLGRPRALASAMALLRPLRPLLPPGLRRRLPARPPRFAPPRHDRRVVMVGGCVQPALAPEIDAAAVRVLDAVGISVVSVPGCCGALHLHLDDEDAARRHARAVIDACLPHLEAGAEAVVMSASGCSVMLKDYAHLLAGDSRYAEAARRVADLARDLSEIVHGEADRLPAVPGATAVAFHAPCTLQHGQRLGDNVETILRRLGHELHPVREAHLCCGSAGAWSLFHPRLSRRLRQRKLKGLTAENPALIATANIGCLMHLRAASPVPVVHWVELAADALATRQPDPSCYPVR